MRVVDITRVAALTILLVAGPASAQTAMVTQVAPPSAAGSARVARAARAAGALTIDGRLDEASWQAAPVADQFLQTRPNPAAPPTQRTEARVLYDDDAIYVGMRLYDSAPDSVVATLGRRDFDGYSDWVNVIIDSYHDRRTAFNFGVNPAGVEWDAYLTGDSEGNADVGWDAVWESATTRDSSGWTAELRIPLSQLRFSAASRKPAAGAGSGSPAWGIQFIRWVARTGERSMWSYIPPGSNGYVSLFGELHGLDEIKPSRRFEVVPYSVMRLQRAPGESTDPFHQPNEWYGTVGADVKYGLTSDLTLTATINPDFGQVEADPSEVNLSGSETFLAERRPFFVEGSDIFKFTFTTVGWQFGQEEIFYSRRIGRAPQGDVPDEAVYDSKPTGTTLLGAMKLSGRTAGGWSIGLLDAVTAHEDVEFVDDAGQRRSESVEPLTNYAMGRVIKDFNRGRSAVGAMFTATNRKLTGDLDALLRQSAYVGGLNFRHRFWNQNYNLSASVLASRVTGTPEAITETQLGSVHYFQRPDADHFELDSTRTSLTGGSAHLAVAKNGGSRFRWGLNGHVLTPGFEANDLGFHPNTDHFVSSAWLGWLVNQPGRLFREWEVWNNYWANWSLSGERRVIGGNLFGRALTRGYWELELELIRNGQGLSTNALRGGPAIFNPARSSFWSRVATDSRKRLTLELITSGMREDETGGKRLDVRPGISVRPSGKMQISLQPGVTWFETPWQYVDQADAIGGERHYIFGSLDQTTVSATARVSYTFSPNLSLQVYAQPFISSGAYGSFKRVAQPRARTFTDRFQTFGPNEVVRDAASETVALDTDGNGTSDVTVDDPDFTSRELITNTVLRWEYRPGSTLFLVWSHGRDEDGVSTFDLGRDTRRLFRADATNTLLVKFSYWLDL
ncbi:MAG TPA: DUF5916 domain-containing protein [Gemmatimonadaceae bacterium]|nr:DUF5916 domain-containing protein [Gemmatimonadaceae bacterium]